MNCLVLFLILVLILIFYCKSTFTGGNWSDTIDIIYYINLDSRPDRKKHFLNEMNRMGVPSNKIKRISAVYKPGQGDWGCSLSHVLALKDFVNNNYKNCIIFEDDFQFIVEKEYLNNVFSKFFTNFSNFDVCMLATNTISSAKINEYLNKVLSAQTTSGYIVNKKFGKYLLNNFIEGTHLIEQSYKQGKSDELQGPYCIDQYWKSLQPTSNWYEFNPILGEQSGSYSNIQGEKI